MTFDAFYRYAMRSARHGFSAQEEHDFTRLRTRWQYLNRIGGHNDHRPLMLNEATPWERPFGVTAALAWAERLAAELGEQ